MKRSFAILFILLFTIPLLAQRNFEHHHQPKVVNFGVKAGFNSSMYLVSEFKIKDVTIEDIQNNYKVGYFGSAFIRLNLQRHYLQPEISYQISRCEIVFDKLGSQHPDIEPDYASISSTTHCIEMPVLYGYNIIKQGSYALSVFGGPKLKYIWGRHNKITFENFDQADIREELYPINISATLGIGVNISKIFFDFRYELGLNNISKSITYDNMPVGQEGTSGMVFDRRESVLSFSFGVMF